MKILLIMFCMITVGCAAKGTRYEIPKECILGGTVQSQCIDLDGHGLALCHEVVVKTACVRIKRVPATNSPVKTDGQTKRRQDEGQPK